LRGAEPQLRARRHFAAQNSRLVLLADRHPLPNLASRLSAVPGTGRRPGPVHPPARRRLASHLRSSHRRRGKFCRSAVVPRHRLPGRRLDALGPHSGLRPSRRGL
jgi:hypothetical protein